MKTNRGRVLGLLMAVTSGLLAPLSAQEKAGSGYEGPPEKLHIYLLIGQSNMAGRAPFSEEEAAAIPGCYLLNGDDQWEPATNPLNRYSTIRKGLGMQKMNPGYCFSQRMLAKSEGVSLGLVVNAKGGTKIEQWGKGTKFYAEALRRAETAQKTGTLKGILWHQGESNNGNPEGYLEKLKTLVESLRKDLNSPDLPFVAGQVIDLQDINDQIAQLPKAVTFTGFASSDGLKGQDRWHFDAPSMRLLGERYADEMLRVQAELQGAK